MDINPYIGNKTHFINSLLESCEAAGFVFTILGSFKTDIIGQTVQPGQLFVQKIVNDVKDQISLLATEVIRDLPALPK